MEKKNIVISQSVMLPLSKLEKNTGQIEGLPANPRLIKDERFQKLVRSIEENPEMLSLRELIVYPLDGGKYIVIGGNMRLSALKELKYKEAPCKVIPKEATVEQLKAYTIKDNSGFGEWDWDMLGNEWDAQQLDDWGVDMQNWDVEEEEPENLDEENKNKDFVAKITFPDAEKLKKFTEMYYDELSQQFGCIISVSGGEI